MKFVCSKYTCKIKCVHSTMGRTGRGAYKRLKQHGQLYTKKYTPWNKDVKYQLGRKSDTARSLPKPLKRVTYQEFKKTFTQTDKGEFVPLAERLLSPIEHSPGAVLRPKSNEKSEVQRILEEKNGEEPVSGYTEVHLPSTVNAVQDCIVEHSQTSPRCQGRLVTASNLVIKWGLSAIMQLKCNTCVFVSAKHKLFREVTCTGPGRKCAEPNRALAVGLFSSSIGVAGSQRIFASIGKTLPAPSSMQKQLNVVGDKIRTLNETDMALQRAKVKDVLEYGGYTRETPIPAESDRQYNNSLRCGRRHTPFAPATQSRDVLVENITPAKKIIGFNHENKLCKVGELARCKGRDVECPDHNGCTATIKACDNAGDEKRGGRKLAISITNGAEPLNVGVLTTDADGRMAEGFSSEMERRNIITEHQLDTIHLNRSVSRAISRAPITPKLATSVPCKYQQRQQAKQRLADSIASRSEQEVRAAHAKYNKDEVGMQAAVCRAIPAVISCFQGNHSLCKQRSLVCNGVHVKYEYLPEFACGAFRFSNEDVKLLTTILSKRMGKEALQKTRFGLTTQKAESMNHAFCTTNPKNSMTCYRNGANRDHSAIHMVNNVPCGGLNCHENKSMWRASQTQCPLS
jgi:hypothetical protein